jgi:hypothetical protein
VVLSHNSAELKLSISPEVGGQSALSKNKDIGPVFSYGQGVKTPYGNGKIHACRDDASYVVNLDWKLADGKCAKAYLTAADLSALTVVLDATGKPAIEAQQRVKTKYGNGTVLEYRPDVETGKQAPNSSLNLGKGLYVVELDWELAGACKAKAYLQASDVTIISRKMRDLSINEVLTKAEGMKVKANDFLKSGFVNEARDMYSQAIGYYWPNPNLG